ncbi:MAG: Eco57I restriction-modification methylase domain-containing protein [Flavobacteriaceae bacterium]|jgi:REP element-mobilizing transposase RayT|nr:Eco57I restriction-modification methylase domain-containing protein [Flavobacteriaceae bacterium]
MAANAGKITIAYKLYVAYFQDVTIQENIRNSKEEQFQEGFLRELFVKILGYTLNPTPNFNLITEQKNETNSKKADGAILVNGEVIGVIELKDTKTSDLKNIETQAFGYKNNHRKASYVVISNFEKLRFYIENTIDFVEFNLFTLSENDFALLWICLAYENIAANLPKQLKNESVSKEDQITRQLYKDYSNFKRDLFADMKEHNKGINPLVDVGVDALVLFKKTQKLLDRLLFIFFAEDGDLLPPNSVVEIIKQWELLKDNDAYFPLYERFKKYFGYLNTGYKGKKHDIFAYNGGLFEPDEILDNIVVSDEILRKHSLKLADYDFKSEIDVNILGHIFENSLTEIEEISAELTRGLNPLLNPLSEKEKISKRKKDGVFYTPRYITAYIVENTIGKLCADKKAELEIDEQEYFADKKRQKETKKKLNDKLETYRSWLLSLTICDPACGSGAFLNAALDFLMTEHKLIDEMTAKLLDSSIVFPNIENAILENNLYGVDINDESVEIARLSLWLRTAKPNRKLNSLSHNIKCGNSLIAPTARGLTRGLNPLSEGIEEIEKAFDWHKEFPQVFKQKDKKAFHVTTAIHDSRTSQRMIDYKVREMRAKYNKGINPLAYADPQFMTEEDEIIITKTIAEIVKEDGLNVLAYNICRDHLHILLVCEEEELDKIVKKIKGRTARACNQNKGINPLVKKEGERSVPFWTQKFGYKEITNNEQLYNTIEYIENNRIKHELPPLDLSVYNMGIHPLVSTIEHAFRPEYKGGFDVVIGNPPYVNAIELKKTYSEKEYNYLKDNYFTAKGTVDLYIYFFERGLWLMNKTGCLSYITPNRFLSASYGLALREFIKTDFCLYQLIDYSDKKVFPDASTYPVITFLKNNENNSSYEIECGKFDEITKELIVQKTNSDKLSLIDDSIWGFLLNDKLPITQKVIAKSCSLKEVGLINATSTAKEADDYSSLINEIEGYKLINTGTIDDYSNNWGISYLVDKGKKYLNPFLPKDSNIISSNRHKLYSSSKIIIAKIGLTCESFYDEFGEYASINTNCIHSFNKDFMPEYVLCWLNSKLYNYTFECLFDGLRMSGGYLLYSAPNLQNTYIYKAPKEIQEQFVPLAKNRANLSVSLQTKRQKFLRRLADNFAGTTNKGINPPVITKALETFDKLDFAQFLVELKKPNKGFKPLALSLKQQDEWEDYFNEYKTECNKLSAEISATDKEIDGLVYALYGLTEEEVKIIEK